MSTNNTKSEIQFRNSSIEGIELVKMVVWDNVSETTESKEFELSIDYCFKVIEFVEMMGFDTKIWTNTNFDTYLILHSEFCDIKSFEALVQIFQSLEIS